MIRGHTNSVFDNRVSTPLGYSYKTSLLVDLLNFFYICLRERVEIPANNHKLRFRIYIIQDSCILILPEARQAKDGFRMSAVDENISAVNSNRRPCGNAIHAV